MFKLAKISQHIIIGLALLVLLLISATILVSHAFMPLNPFEVPLFVYNQWYQYVFLVLFLVLLVVLYWPFGRLPAQYLFAVCAGVYFIFGIHLIFNITSVIRADAAMVHMAVPLFQQGDYSWLSQPGWYLDIYPHQLGLLTFEKLYYLFGSSPRAGFVFNLFFIIGTNYLQYRLVDRLFASKRLTNYTILLSFLFLPQFFYILFLYGTVPGLFFALLGVERFLVYQEKGGVFPLVVSSLSMALACLVRNNFQIVVVALCILTALSFLRKKEFKQLLPGFCILVSVFLLQFGVNTYYSQKIGKPLPTGIPKVAFLAMGLREIPGYPTRNGIYDGYTVWVYGEQGFDTQAAAQVAQKEVVGRLSDLAKNPVKALEFFYTKVRTTWTDPVFQAIWTGPSLQEHTEESRSVFWKSLYSSGSAYHRLYLVSFVVVVVMYLFSLLGVVKDSLVLKQTNQLLSTKELYGYLIFLGGFFFHLFWEVKSQYVYIYLVLLVPVAAKGFLFLVEKLPFARSFFTNSLESDMEYEN